MEWCQSYACINTCDCCIFLEKNPTTKNSFDIFLFTFQNMSLECLISLRHFTTYSTLFLNDHPNCQNPIKANAFYTYYDSKKLIWYFIHHTFISITYISDTDVHWVLQIAWNTVLPLFCSIQSITQPIRHPVSHSVSHLVCQSDTKSVSQSAVWVGWRLIDGAFVWAEKPQTQQWPALGSYNGCPHKSPHTGTMGQAQSGGAWLSWGYPPAHFRSGPTPHTLLPYHTTHTPTIS